MTRPDIEAIRGRAEVYYVFERDLRCWNTVQEDVLSLLAWIAELEHSLELAEQGHANAH